MIHAVPTRLIKDLWPAVEPHVKRACKYHPFMSTDDVLQVILWGAAQLFVATKPGGIAGFAVMEVVQYPSRKLANVMLAGGDRGFLSVAVHELLPILRQWGAEQDADDFALLGARPGWVRALRNAGFKSAPYVTMWAGLDVEGRRKQQHTAAGHDERTVEGSAAVPH